LSITAVFFSHRLLRLAGQIVQIVFELYIHLGDHPLSLSAVVLAKMLKFRFKIAFQRADHFLVRVGNPFALFAQKFSYPFQCFKFQLELAESSSWFLILLAFLQLSDFPAKTFETFGHFLLQH